MGNDVAPLIAKISYNRHRGGKVIWIKKGISAPIRHA
jgi:hypothetical protein